MRVKATVELPVEITKDSIVQQLQEENQKLNGKIGRLEQKVQKLELLLADSREEMGDARKFLDVVTAAAEEHLKLRGYYDE